MKMSKKKKGNEEKNMESALLTQESVQEKGPGFWRDVWQQTRLVFRLLRDPEVPFYLKFVPALGLLYVIMPIDLITDFAPVIGQLDDITALIVGAKVFIELAPPHVVARHLREIQIQDGYQTVIEGNADVVDTLDDMIILDPDTGDVIVQKEPEDLDQ
jgi:uncharacterized membrane protein YkvA (DUF1232 family)